MIEAPLQIGPDIVPDLSTGRSILYVGLFGALTLLTMKLNSAIALVSWAITGVMFMLVLLGLLGFQYYIIALIFSFLALGATSIYAVSNP